MKADLTPLTYIHIGTVKTGTTYLQKIFYENSEIFSQFGISYPFVFPARIDLPRYANAEFLTNNSGFEETKKILSDRDRQNILISEESIFNKISQLKNPAFAGLSKKIILYVRRPAELICSWAAECAQPYNAFVANYALEAGPLGITAGMAYLSRWYERSIREFVALVEETPSLEVTVRPFERESMLGNDLLTDFLGCLGIDAAAVRRHPEFRDSGFINGSRSRKHCDISEAVWRILRRPKVPFPYDLTLVDEIASICESGDCRAVIDTVEDSVIEEITERFAHFEAFLSERFLDGEPLLRDRYPPTYQTQRPPYRPLDRDELDLVTKLVLLRRSRREGVAAALAPRTGEQLAVT